MEKEIESITKRTPTSSYVQRFDRIYGTPFPHNYVAKYTTLLLLLCTII